MVNLADKTKGGRLRVEEMHFIRENKDKMSPEEMCNHLNRKISTIIDYLQKIPNIQVNNNVERLKAKPFWKILESQFTEDEMGVFADEYFGFLEQVKGELLHAEAGQVIDAIRHGILADRCLKEAKDVRDRINELEIQILEKKQAGEIGLESLEHQLALNRQISDKSSEKYADLIEKKAKILDKLKLSRNQREDAINSAFKTSFKDWMKRIISDDKYREEIGRHMERHRIAADQEYKRLTQPHKYVDNVVDLPILDTESVKNLEDD